MCRSSDILYYNDCVGEFISASYELGGNTFAGIFRRLHLFIRERQMSNIGKYMWGEFEDNFLSDIFDTIEECENDIVANRHDITRDRVYIGQITMEFDYALLANDVAMVAEANACEFDADASIDVEVNGDIEELLRKSLDMLPFKVKVIKTVKLEDLL
jgi:hypothetical protein